MAEDLVLFNNVWKKFVRGERGRASRSDFWALEDVSFRVSRGEALGIIGPNGAGKSTALKLLTKIMRPTRGDCAIRGRVGALIEVAAGFHPDLTGRENVYLQGAIMGMKRADITRKLEDIVDFSGLGDFIDTQVKRYSSGMNARLGFSIAANLDPDVLVIDEVLAVGDMAFQLRCSERMRQFRDRGVAIVLVSHDLQAVSSLCQRAIFLNGSVRAEGLADDVISAYVSSASAVQATADDAVIEITGARLLDARDQALREMVHPGTALAIRVSLRSRIGLEAAALVVTFGVYRSTDNLAVCEEDFTGAAVGLQRLAAGETQDVQFAFQANLTRGHYHVAVRVLSADRSRVLASGGPPAAFVVDEKQTWTGIVHLDVHPTVRVAAAAPLLEHQ